MRVAIVHYHLQPGGVTRIIGHTISALAGRDTRIVVLTGQEPAGDWPSEWRVIPGLRYEGARTPVGPEELARRMERAAREALGGPPDLWHVHNHSLGKNLALPGALVELAGRGGRLLLHIHDFAEDGRPANYHLMLEKMARGSKQEMSRLLYPVGGHVHYAVLNGRDYAFLGDAGAGGDCLHLLPNPVQLGDQGRGLPPGPDDRTLWLYPTRAIRRKNIGEFLLWSAVAGEGHCFATTLGPENPRERPRYEMWKRIAAELDLPVQFEIATGCGCSFEELLGRARSLVTTSVAEGFGLAFLEPWLVGRPVCGRDLPEITADFDREGIMLPWLYERLDVPVSWLGLGRIADRAAAGQQQILDAYGRSESADCLERILAAWIRDDHVDFGRLDEEMQEIILRRLVRDPDQARRLHPSALPDPAECDRAIESNRRLLREKYSLQGYGERLHTLYRQVAGSGVTRLSFLDGEVLLDHFLAPERLKLLRVD
ncbi:MAG TPA: hypothetical protein ENI89_02140 [Desulfobulbus sp.]|nr:hypothetical protein [Desulfobulbus sp.]